MTKRNARKRRSAASDPNAPGASRRSLLWRARRPLFFLGVIVVASLVGVLWVASQVQIPTTNPIVDQTSFVCAANVAEDCNETNAIASLHGDVNRVVVPLSDISPEMQNAVLAAEDKDFFRHGGVDPVGIARAAWLDIRGGATTHGGSTLTQQYVKLTYLTSERTFERKIKEAILSVKLEQQLTKKQIFERYLNLVYFGRGAYGVQAAAQTYFDVDAADLDLSQAAFLAGIVRNPSWAQDDAKALSLRNLVLRNMSENNMIDAAQRLEASSASLGVIDYHPTTGVNWLGGPLGKTGDDPYAARYFVQSVIEGLVEQLGKHRVFNGGLRIYTTLEPERQKQAYEAVTSVLNFDDHPSGALAAVDGKGQVVAMMGGTDYDTNKVNLATGAGGTGRQIGSTFKAFALADLAKHDYAITSSVPAPYKTTFLASEHPGVLTEDWPVRSDCCTSGVASVVDATAQSINSAYVNIMFDLGPKQVVQTAHELGVTSRFEMSAGKPHYLPAYVLGSANIPVVQVADAFSTFARNGVRMDATMVTRVEDRSGNVLASYTPTREQVLTATQNARVVYALQKVIEEGTATSADIGRPAAGKTGTVAVADTGTGDDLEAGEENTDAWFTGFVPGLTASVWMGYESGGRVMPSSFAGASYPTEIWRTFMKAALADTKPQDFPAVGEDALGEGKFLTSWGGTRYLSPALTVEDFEDGSPIRQQVSDGSQSGGSQSGGSQSGPATTVWQGNSGNEQGDDGGGQGDGDGGGGGPPPTVPETAPENTAPPVTQPPVTPPPTVAPVQ
ncbi:MAG TPA: transglycosylase domain-containing protein [Acidimicrobiales bacterium]|nr:transglycosylase domain-containing protein [Acidimicrobiales bacterium]